MDNKIEKAITELTSFKNTNYRCFHDPLCHLEWTYYHLHHNRPQQAIEEMEYFQRFEEIRNIIDKLQLTVNAPVPRHFGDDPLLS